MKIELERIGWKDEPDESTPIEAANLIKMEENTEKAINTVAEKNIITATFSKKIINVTKGWEATPIALETALIEGDKLIFENNKVKIGEGVNKILVSAFTRGLQHPSTTGDKMFSIFKNTENIAFEYQGGIDTGNYIGACIAQQLVEVKKGDLIFLMLSSGIPTNVEMLGGYLTVQVV